MLGRGGREGERLEQSRGCEGGMFSVPKGGMRSRTEEKEGCKERQCPGSSYLGSLTSHHLQPQSDFLDVHPKTSSCVPTPALTSSITAKDQQGELAGDPAHAEPWIPSSRAQVASAGLGHSPATSSQTGQESLAGFQGFAFAADSVGSWSSNLPVKEPLSPDSPSPSGSLISQLTTE